MTFMEIEDVEEEVTPTGDGARSESQKATALQELDAEVAEKVMGLAPCDAWAETNFGSAGGPALRKNCDHNKAECYPTRTISSVWGRIGGCPAFSTDIVAAIQVVEKLRAEGWSFACTLYEGKLPYASFCKKTAASSRNAEAETLPEAICRAALALVNSTDEEVK